MEFEDNEIKMVWEDDSKLSNLAKLYKSITPLKTTSDILAFIGERTPDMRRPGLAPFLAHIGCNFNSTPVEVFTKNHGVSANDLFWIETKKDKSFWEELKESWCIE
jgi:hypothetical protein